MGAFVWSRRVHLSQGKLHVEFGERAGLHAPVTSRIRGETGLLEELKVMRVLEILLIPVIEEALTDIPTHVRTWGVLKRKILTSAPGWCQSIDIGGETHMELVSVFMCSCLIHLKHLEHYHLIIVPHHNAGTRTFISKISKKQKHRYILNRTWLLQIESLFPTRSGRK